MLVTLKLVQVSLCWTGRSRVLPQFTRSVCSGGFGHGLTEQRSVRAAGSVNRLRRGRRRRGSAGSSSNGVHRTRRQVRQPRLRYAHVVRSCDRPKRKSPSGRNLYDGIPIRATLRCKPGHRAFSVQFRKQHPRRRSGDTGPSVIVDGQLPATPGTTGAVRPSLRCLPRRAPGLLDPPHAGNRTPVAAFACPADVRLLRPLVAASGRSVALASYIGVAGSGIAPFLPMNQEAPGGGFDWH